MNTLKPCPFCGNQPREDDLEDAIYPYNRERTIWMAGCVVGHGGCDAEVLAGSRQEAIDKWNTRVGDKK